MSEQTHPRTGVWAARAFVC